MLWTILAQWFRLSWGICDLFIAGSYSLLNPSRFIGALEDDRVLELWLHKLDMMGGVWCRISIIVASLVKSPKIASVVRPRVYLFMPCLVLSQRTKMSWEIKYELKIV